MFEFMSENTAKTCPQCNGLGYRYVDGREGVTKCECKVEDPAARAVRLLKAAEIPRKYADCRLSNYLPPPENPYLLTAFDQAVTYINNYLKQPTPKGLLFQGPPGLGKTHLAISIVRELIERESVSCFFC